MNVTNSFKRFFSIICSILLLVTPLYVSSEYVKANDSVSNMTTKSKHTEIINNVTNATSSDEISILVDYNGGISNGNASMTLTKYPNESFGIISPSRENYIFNGWEILSGDSTIELKNGSYILTVGTQDTIIRALWKTEAGEDVTDTPSPTTEVTTKPELTPSSPPIQKYITVTVSLEGGTYNGESIVTQTVAAKNTIVLFQNVDLLRKEGYKVAGFVSNYGGSCMILSDKRVLYTAPSYDNTKLDLVNVVWERIDNNPSADNINATPANKNTVYVNLDGGKFSSSGDQEAIFYIDVNTPKTLFKTSDIEKEGYTLKEFKITDGVKYLIQGEDVILLSTDYQNSGITLTAIWEQNIAITSKPTVQPTNNTSTPTIIQTQIPSPKPTTQPTDTTDVTTIVPSQTTTTTSTIEATTIPTTMPTTSPIPAKITLKSNTIYMGVDETVAIKATATQGFQITYKSQNNRICSVTSNGILFSHKTGKTQIVISAGGIIKKITVYVLLKPSKIGLTSKMKKKITYSIRKGKTKQLKVYFYKNSYSNKITFTSSNKKIATVTSKGKVKAKQKGICKITVKSYNGKKAIAIIKVK